MSATTRLALPLLAPGQVQKELFHNEALLLLDIALAAAVEGPATDAPPASPAEGSCYLVGASPTGAWEGRPSHIACFTSSGWRFVAPVPGLTVCILSSGHRALYRAGAWEIGSLSGSRLLVEGQQVVGSQAAAIANPSGGSTSDAQARAAIGEILAALRQHGLIAQ